MIFNLVLLGFMVNQSGAFPVPLDKSPESEAQYYLASFGYLDPELKNSSTSSVSAGTVRNAVSEFQSFFGLDPTGIMNEETLTWMRKPRCGLPDRDITKGSSTRRKRRIDVKDRWTKGELTYGIRKHTPDLDKSVVDREIAKAFRLWEEVIPLTFTFVETGNVDIDISFESGSHSDSKDDTPFKGPGEVLAHAFFPQSGGDVHFDEAETWTISSDGTNLFQLATHEFGHALGLAHFESKTDVMFPTFEYRRDFKLEPNDINRIQQLYGINNKWLKYKLSEIADDLKNLKNELKETKKELNDAKNTIAELETNGHTKVKSTAFYFYVQRNSAFNVANVAIPFDVARVNNGNAMDLSLGIFLAPRSGIYFFSFTGLASFPETKSPNKVQLGIGLYLRGQRVGSALTEESNTVDKQKCPLSLQSTLKLEKHDNLWLQIDVQSTSEVSLFDDAGPGRDGHWTHFTGWMLQEEILESL